MERGEKLLIALSILSLFLITMILIQNVEVQRTKLIGYATEQTTLSNVSISKFLSIALSANLSEGIIFGSINTLPAINENATHNYDGANTTNPSPGSSLFVNVSTDSNTAVDFCVKADFDLNNSADDKIGIGNETYYNSTDTNSSLPDLSSEVSLTTSYVKAGPNVAIGGDNYYRFWLDVPVGQASGTYNNTISFKGIEASTSC